MSNATEVTNEISSKCQILSVLTWVDADMKQWKEVQQQLPRLVRIPVEFIDTLLRGVGQVVLMNNPITGILILIGLFYANWWISLCGVFGLFVSTITALLCDFNTNAIKDGIHGYNGFLVGLALATFTENENWLVLFPILFTSPLTSIFLAYFAQSFSVPACTLPFCFATSIFVLGSYSYSYFPVIGIEPFLSSPLTVPYKGINLSEFFESILTGISQIFLASNVWTAGFVFTGMCFCSRISAFMCLVGSTIGLFFAFALGIDRGDIYFGLWGFNSALSAICIGGMFFKFSIGSFLYAVLCCIGTCLIQGALFGLFAPLGVPIFTFPFNFGVLIYLIGYTSFNRFGLTHVPLSEMVTPETFLYKQKSLEYVPLL